VEPFNDIRYGKQGGLRNRGEKTTFNLAVFVYQIDVMLTELVQFHFGFSAPTRPVLVTVHVKIKLVQAGAIELLDDLFCK
jgi:hypothetical protein